MSSVKVGPGLYEVRLPGGGLSLHISIPEMLEHYGFANTEENRETCAEAARELLRKTYPDIIINDVS